MTTRRGRDIPDGQADSTYVMTRAEDRSIWMKSAHYLEKYRVLVYAIAGFLAAAGFGFETPKTAMASLRNELKIAAAAESKRVDGNEARIERLERIAVAVEALVRVRCLERERRSVDVMSAAGIDCASYLDGHPPIR